MPRAFLCLCQEIAFRIIYQSLRLHVSRRLQRETFNTFTWWPRCLVSSPHRHGWFVLEPFRRGLSSTICFAKAILASEDSLTNDKTTLYFRRKVVNVLVLMVFHPLRHLLHLFDICLCHGTVFGIKRYQSIGNAKHRMPTCNIEDHRCAFANFAIKNLNV